MLKTLAVAAGLASGVLGLGPANENHSFQPEITHEYTVHPEYHAPNYFVRPSAEDVARDFLAQKIGDSDWIVADQYSTKHNGVTHIYLHQVFHGLRVANGQVNLNIDAHSSQVLSYGESTFHGEVPEKFEDPAVMPREALRNLAAFLDVELEEEPVMRGMEKGVAVYSSAELSLDDIPVKLELILSEHNKELVPSWNVVVRQHIHWYNAFIRADTGDVIALYDWTHFADYFVYPIGTNDPDDGPREMVNDPHVPAAGSPLGWHDTGSQTYQDTRGNNAFAQENHDGSSSWENNYRPSGGQALRFDFPINFNEHPHEYKDAAITNLFVWVNWFHDIMYVYGWDEPSGNCQENNFGNGGLGNDAVQANAQDGAGYNNANMATPPDGSRPRMRMYLWNTYNPMRDGDFDNGIIVHEYAHSLSIRLTGGPSNTGCMSGGQAGGMGEGHGDCISLFLRWRPEYNYDTSFGMGNYVVTGDTIRIYNYSTNMNVNPATYEYINGPSYSGVHAKGSMWCGALYDVFVEMVTTYGFDPDWYNGNGANNVVLQDLLDAMKLDPCQPTFLNTRDSMILADEINYNGRYVCDYWRMFARRGMGINAVDTNNAVREDFTLPPECR